MHIFANPVTYMYIHAYVKFLLVKVYIAIYVCIVKISALYVLFNFCYVYLHVCMYVSCIIIIAAVSD